MIPHFHVLDLDSQKHFTSSLTPFHHVKLCPHMWSRNKINSVLATIYFISAPHVRTALDRRRGRWRGCIRRGSMQFNGGVSPTSAENIHWTSVLFSTTNLRKRTSLLRQLSDVSNQIINHHLIPETNPNQNLTKTVPCPVNVYC